jgi:hypothetical protein
MIPTGMPNAIFHYFASNRQGTLQMALFEQDFAERVEQIDSYRVIAPKSRSYENERLVQ